MQLALDVRVRLIKTLRRLAQVLIDLNVSDRSQREYQRSRNERALTDALHFDPSGDPDELFKRDHKILAFPAASRLQEVAGEDAVLISRGELRALVHRRSEGDFRPKRDQSSLELLTMLGLLRSLAVKRREGDVPAVTERAGRKRPIPHWQAALVEKTPRAVDH